MTDDIRDSLGTYVRWAEGFTPDSLERSLEDLATLRRGQLSDSDEYQRTTPAGPTERHYRKLRADRDDLDFREWNSDTGYCGVHRWPSAPGVCTQHQQRRRHRRQEIDEGF